VNRSRLIWVALGFLLSASFALAQGVTLPDVQRVELANGAVFILHEKRDVPLIGVQATLRGGGVSDPGDKQGLASLLAEMLEKGASQRDAATFAEAVAGVGGTLSARAGLESISISGSFLAQDADLMVELLVDMLRRPVLAASEMKKLRDRRINLIRAAKDGDPRRLSPIYGNAFLFGEHSYGAPVGGNEESLARITHRDLLRYYRDNVGGDRLIVAVAGDFDAAAMAEKLSAAFSDWRSAAATLAEVESPAFQLGRRVLLVDKPGATQTYFWLGNIGVSVNYAQRAELNIANTLFGGRFTSLLMDELRTKAGLTYGARSTLLRPAAAGSVAIVSSTKTEATITAIDLALSLLARLHEDGFGADMISSGKNYILGLYPPRLETSAQLAAQFAWLEARGLSASFVNDYGDAISNADTGVIHAVINEVYPAPENLVFVIIGDAGLIRDDIAKYGPVTEMPITDPRFQPLRR